MTAIVIDASIAVCWLMPDEVDDAADRAWNRAIADGVRVPMLFPIEIRNVLVVNERRRRIEPEATDAGLAALSILEFDIDGNFDGAELVAIARRRGLSVYDAAYLELALRRNCVLATLDNALAKAALAEGVTLV